MSALWLIGTALIDPPYASSFLYMTSFLPLTRLAVAHRAVCLFVTAWLVAWWDLQVRTQTYSHTHTFSQCLFLPLLLIGVATVISPLCCQAKKKKSAAASLRKLSTLNLQSWVCLSKLRTCLSASMPRAPLDLFIFNLLKLNIFFFSLPNVILSLKLCKIKSSLPCSV